MKHNASGFSLVELLLVVAIIATLAAISLPVYANALRQARTARAIGDINTIGFDIMVFQMTTGALPSSLAEVGRQNHRDPWGSAYEYFSFDDAKGKGSMRKDRFLVPLNSDFDLYSKGPDRKSVPPLTAEVSRDDIIRANDGGYIGLASEY